MTVRTHSGKQTLALAKKLATKFKGGDILLLEGELGSGKTTFTQGLAAAFGIKEKIKSPTFVLMRQHKIKNAKLKIKNFVHVDAYRVKDAQELREIGLSDWLGRPDTVVVVEWGEKIKSLLRGGGIRRIEITFTHGTSQNERIISTRA